MDKRLGLCNDVGHTLRSGVDPSVDVEKFQDRLIDIHMRDVDFAQAKGQCIEVGRGAMDVPKLLRTLSKINYQGVLALEFDKDPDDPLTGMAESIGYLRGVLEGI